METRSKKQPTSPGASLIKVRSPSYRDISKRELAFTTATLIKKRKLFIPTQKLISEETKQKPITNYFNHTKPGRTIAKEKQPTPNNTPSTPSKPSIIDVEQNSTEGATKIFSIVYANLQGMDQVNVKELQEIQRKTGCDAFSLSETWHRPESWIGYESRWDNLLQIMPDWKIFQIHCACPDVNKHAPKHGMALIIHPDLDTKFLKVQLHPELEQYDHRQLSALIRTRSGELIDHLGVHFVSGESGGLERGAHKRLQFRAAFDHLKCGFGEIKIIGGDVNIRPTWKIWGEFFTLCQENRMTIQSLVDLWSSDNPPFTRENPDGSGRGFLDHVIQKCNKNFVCKVALLGKSDFQLTTDHKQPLLLEIYKKTSGYKSVLKPFDFNPLFERMCPFCGRGYNGSIHQNCKYSSKEELILTLLEGRRQMNLNKCALCGQRYATEKGFNIHTKMHFGKRSYKCKFEQCNMSFLSALALTAHTKRHKLCATCGKTFVNTSNLKQHMRVHTGEKPFTCPACRKTFSLKSNLKRHWICHTGEKPFTCTTCRQSFALKSYLKKHLICHTGAKPFTCTTCRQSFTFKSNLKKHLICHTGAKPFTCTTCQKTFSLKSNLRKHLICHTGAKPFTCVTCQKTFSLKSNLKKHLICHTGEKPFTCVTCQKTFVNKSNLDTHMICHTGAKRFTCVTCQKTFSLKSNMQKHLICHTGAKPFTCTTCQKTFSLKSNMQKHLICHTGAKPFTCVTCQKTFSLKSNLKKHLICHTGEKPFTCVTCQKTFVYKFNLEIHMRVHTGEKPFTCTTCQKTFVNTSNLNTHMRVHTREKPYSCPACRKTFSQKSNLDTHMRGHTRVKPYTSINKF